MSYDFVIQAVDVPAGISFPLSLESLLSESPEALQATIPESAAFWQRIAEYPGMRANSVTPPADNFIYEGKRFPGSGFQVYAVRKFPPGFVESRWAALTQQSPPGSPEEFLKHMAASEAELRKHPLQGIHLDMSGSWYDVLDLYVYLKCRFRNLHILDMQTCLIHDEASFARFVSESGAR